MNDHHDTTETIEICFEVGHSSTIRSKATTNHVPPRTHDWKVYLRSADVHGDLTCLIQRCVFHLHPEFPNHKRELLTTPFAIQESGYAGFCLPIEIFFKTKKEPKKYLIEYDLDLHQNSEGHVASQKKSYLRKYRCSFYNPDAEFRQKILAAGGKIVDSGPIPSNDIDSDDGNMNVEPVSLHDAIPRRSPQQKRPISPAPTPNVASKKPRLEQPSNSVPKKSIPSVVKTETASKATVTIKKPKPALGKATSVSAEKVSKSFVVKELNPPTSTNESTKNTSLSKPRLSTKLVKSHSLNDFKSSSQPTPTNHKKKEPLPSPAKPKIVPHTQNAPKKSITKNPQKASIKAEHVSTSTVKSPLTVVIKQETLSQASTGATPASNAAVSASINTLKKIPKKPAPTSSSVIEKRSRLSMPSSSLSRNSTRVSSTGICSDVHAIDTINPQESLRDDSVPSKNKSTLKRDPSSSSISNVVPEKKKIIKKKLGNQTISFDRDVSRNLDRPDGKPSEYIESNRRAPSPPQRPSSSQPKQQTTIAPPKLPRTPSPTPNAPSVSSIISTSSIETSQPSNLSSPADPLFANEDDHTLSSMDADTRTSDKSSTFHEPMPIQATNTAVNQICYSDHSDTSDDDLSQDDDNHDADDDDDLPSSLTNDDLRYKLIYIYKRFQLNSLNDLIIFVRFFKRHQLIDTTTLSTAKTSDDMFTYDLFSLSPSHIGELANDLGYTMTSTMNSIEQ